MEISFDKNQRARTSQTRRYIACFVLGCSWMGQIQDLKTGAFPKQKTKTKNYQSVMCLQNVVKWYLTIDGFMCIIIYAIMPGPTLHPCCDTLVASVIYLWASEETGELTTSFV